MFDAGVESVELRKIVEGVIAVMGDEIAEMFFDVYDVN